MTRIELVKVKGNLIPETLRNISSVIFRLKKFPELKFKYVEDDNTVDFFVPYVWRLAYQFSTIYWDPCRIKVFSALCYT